MSDRPGDGSLPPEILTDEIPGPASRRLSAELERFEAPGINTLYQGRPSLLWREAVGANVVDVDGNRYVDLTAGFGVAAVGHRHPKVVAAVRRQSETLLHALGDVMAHPARVELSRRLADLVPVRGRDEDRGEDRGEDDDGGYGVQTHLAVSGSDALEIAAKTALLHFRKTRRTRRRTSHRRTLDRRTFLVFDPSYHGLSLGALALTSRPAFREPFAAHLHPHVERRPFGSPMDGTGTDGIAELLRTRRVAAVFVEPVVGREGVIPAPAGWLEELSHLCRETGTLLVADEIFTGFGRTGRLFAVEHELAGDSLPDLVCCGKALAGGLPIGAVVGRRELMAAWSTPGEALHTGTFVGHPLACAAALASLDVITDPAAPLAARAAGVGAEVAERLAAWPARFDAVEAVRGLGLLHGVVLRDADAAGRWSARARARGILLLAGGPEGRVAQIVPPLTIDRDLLHLTLDLLEDSF